MQGEIHVEEPALAAIIGLAAHEVPGVVGMSPVGLKEGLSRILGKREAKEGVVVKPDPERPGAYTADLYVVVAYGVNIPAVVESVGERVTWAARELAGKELSRVVVHVTGVKRGKGSP